uniref:Wsv133-like protein n=1 Tax=Litopenaeus vannamei majanivirus Nimav-1_LVa TaxID=2984273 RepID=A0A9C7BPW7_9VIRU|nr:MAG: wsv133-like protein [Litopenaeus vannamei majanivirus Nimav-1_LVa]
MAANAEYMHILKFIKRNLLASNVFDDPDKAPEKKLLTELAEEAAFVGFFAEIGSCISHNNLVAINSRLQKQSKTTISLQLGSHIDAEFETLKSDILIDNHYKSLLTSKDEKLDRKMQSGRKSISGSKRRTIEPLWRHMVEFEKQKRRLHIFSLNASPLKYEKDTKRKPKLSNEEDSDEDDECDDDEGEGNNYNDDHEENITDRERKFDKKCNATTTAATTSWPFCDNCECVNSICRALENDDDNDEEA